MLLVATLVSIVAGSNPDSLQAAKFLALAAKAHLVAPGARWVVVPPAHPRGEAVLLADGTERARLDSAGWIRFESWRNDSLADRAPDTDHPPALPAIPQWISWIAPPSGGDVRFGWSVAEGAASAPWNALEGEINWLQSLGRWVSLGGGVAWEQQTPDWQHLDATGHFGAVLAACVPALCWEMRQKASPYPAAAMFEKDLDTIVVRKRPGALLQRLPTSTTGYWQQSFEAHVGMVRWRATYAPDAWKGLLQEVSLEDIPAGVLRWGVSVAWTADQAMTGFSLATAPWNLAGWRFGTRRQELSWEVARIDLLYARTDQARLAVGTRLHFSDPMHAGVSK